MRFDAREFLSGLYAATATLEPELGDVAGYWARRAAALLSGVADPDLRADLRELFEHRAAVCEFDGGLSRTDAERLAFGELQAAMKESAESN